MPRPCPTCGAPAAWEGNPDRPFCSERCRLIDLGRWASEEYTVPGEAVDVEHLSRDGSPTPRDDDE